MAQGPGEEMCALGPARSTASRSISLDVTSLQGAHPFFLGRDRGAGEVKSHQRRPRCHRRDSRGRERVQGLHCSLGPCSMSFPPQKPLF